MGSTCLMFGYYVFEQVNLIGQRKYGMKMLCIIMGYKVMSMHYVYKWFDYVI